MINILVAFFAFAANMLQLVLMIKGIVTVPRISWILWSIIIGFSFSINLLYNGWDTATISLGSFTVGNLFIAGYIIKKQKNVWSKKEKSLLYYSFIIMCIWIPFKIIESEKSLLWATVISIFLLRLIHFFGVWEYWNKIYKDPFTESIWPWFLRWTSALIASSSIIKNQTSFESKERMYISFSQPTYLVITVSITIILITLRKNNLKK